jgi:sugar lactone lactonase YvrE
MRLRTILALAAALGLAACGDDDPNIQLEPEPPTQVSMVTTGGFEEPMDAVASPDGATFYFSAYDISATANPLSSAAIFAVPSAGGQAQVLVSGPPLEDPTGLLMSCDGATLFVADLSYRADDAEPGKAPIYTLEIATSTLRPVQADGIGEAASLAFNKDCSTLYVTGYTTEGVPAVFTLSPAGGAVTVLKQGAPLESPSGVYVDANDVAWVMDHINSNQVGGGLWAIDPAGNTTEVIAGLRISEPAGVSLVSAGQIAVIPTRDENGMGQLITIDTETGAQTIVAAPDMLEPAGIRTATEAPVMAVVDTDGNAIYRAE